MTGQAHARRSFEIVMLQSLAFCEAAISAVNSRFVGKSNATIVGVAKRGRQRAASLRVAPWAAQPSKAKTTNRLRMILIRTNSHWDQRFVPCPKKRRKRSQVNQMI